jgi:hypothetical protein
LLARDDRYFRQQTTTDDYFRSTFDSHRSTQRIDGTGDTHYQGNRTLGGNGWQGHWTLRQFEEFEPEQGSDHMPLFPEDDRPNSYDVTLDNSSEASADTPIAYGFSTNPPVNTPPSGSLGPGSFSPPEDSQSIISFYGDVAMAGSTALMDHAARDAAFAELAAETEPSCDMADPDCEAIDTTESGPEAMRRYAEGQGALPTPEIPEAIRIEIGNGEHMWIINPDRPTNPPVVTGDGLCPCGCGMSMLDIPMPDDGPGEPGGTGGAIRLPLTPREPWNPSLPAENIFGIRPPRVGDRVYAHQNSGPTYQTPVNTEEAGFGVRDAASIGVGLIPFVGSGQSVVELISGYDYISGEPTSRWLAAVGIIAGVVPGGKGALKGGSKLIKIAGEGATHADEFVDIAKAVSKAPARIDAKTWQEYETGIRSLYGEASFSSRQYTAIVDGKLVNGVADNVATIGGRSVAVEAKWVKGSWLASPRNPSSKIGDLPFAVEEQATMLQQARKYSAAFDEVIYYSNSPELIAYYTTVFRNAGIANFRFVLKE